MASFFVLFPIHPKNGGEGLDSCGADGLAGKGLGAICGKMLLIGFYDVVVIVCRLAFRQIAFVGENRAKEAAAGTVIGANLKAKTAFKTFCNGILLLMVLLFSGGDFLQIHFRLV